MSQTDIHALLQRYQRGECTPEEIHVVDQWYELLGQERAPLQLTTAEQEEARASMWQQISARTHQAEDLSPPAAHRPWYAGSWRWAAAAVLAISAGLGAQNYLTRLATVPVATVPLEASGWQHYANTTAQPHTVRLIDGTTVRVSPGGQLKYPSHFAAQHRTVYLKGEAFFEVAHDKAHPFRVYTRQIVTTVLGTSFLVQAPQNEAPVVVKVRTGRVRVQPRPSAELAATPAPLVVLPNQQAVYSPQRNALARQLVAEPVQVASQSFTFDDRPVVEVLTALEKAYGVDIDFDAQVLTGCSVTLNLREESLYAKLDVLCKTLGASYQKTDTNILFRSSGCAAR
ncbi:FecR domain-containing protein [Hymenobacter sp. UYP22]|uniref:FecR family protein n=1 Tax=Hymenobacter sp. UYP22 TaxID=3156348 RepID=UPI00339B89CC